TALGIYFSAVLKRPVGAVAATYIFSIVYGLFAMFTVYGSVVRVVMTPGGSTTADLIGPSSVLQVIATMFVLTVVVVVIATGMIIAAVPRLQTDGEIRHTPLRVCALIWAGLMMFVWFLIGAVGLMDIEFLRIDGV